MVLYWFFNLPTYVSFIIITGFFPAFGFLELPVSIKTFYKKLSYAQERKDQVSLFMSMLGLF